MLLQRRLLALRAGVHRGAGGIPCVMIYHMRTIISDDDGDIAVTTETKKYETRGAVVVLEFEYGGGHMLEIPLNKNQREQLMRALQASIVQ